MTEPYRNRWLGHLRIVVLYLFLAALLWFSRPTSVSLIVGGLLLSLGEGFRIWSAGHLVKSVELITSGPYAYVQHPLYLGRLLILTGFCVLARLEHFGNLGILAAGYGGFFFYYFPRKLRVEGKRLRERHGESWTRYSDTVPRLFPWRTAYAGVRRSWSLRRAIGNQEYLVFTGLVILFLLFVGKFWMIPG